VDTAAVTVDPRVWARTMLVLVGAVVVQLAVVTDLRLFGVHPELVLAVAIGTAIAWGPERGAVVGFAAGLLTDLSMSGRFGLSSLAFALAGWGIGALADGVVRRSRLLDAALLAGGSAAGLVLYAVVGGLFGERTLADPHLWRILGIVSLCGAALSPLVLPVCRWAGEGDERLRPGR